MDPSRDSSSVPVMSSDEPNPYDLLELAVEATDADIRRAYRQRSLKIHPDKVSSFCDISA